jgi:hypothetical protein
MAGKKGPRGYNKGPYGEFRKEIKIDRRYKSFYEGALAKDTGKHKRKRENSL